MPKIYGYIRISKDTSDAENQLFELNRANIHLDEVVRETVSGNTDASDRELGRLIERLQPGDTIAVADVSRLGRRSLDVMETGARIVKKKARASSWAGQRAGPPPTQSWRPTPLTSPPCERTKSAPPPSPAPSASPGTPSASSCGKRASRPPAKPKRKIFIAKKCYI
jgi:hypothetical protein